MPCTCDYRICEYCSSLQKIIKRRKEKGMYKRNCVKCSHSFLNEYKQSRTICASCYYNKRCILRIKNKQNTVPLINKRLKQGRYLKQCIRCNTPFQNNNYKSRRFCKQCTSKNVMYDRQRDTICTMCFETRTPNEFTGHPTICNWCLINQRLQK